MTDRSRLYAAMLDGDDYGFLSDKYDMSVDTLMLWTDAEWCQFLNCVPEELPYFLLGDVEPQIETEWPDVLEDEFDRARHTGRSWDDEEVEDDYFAPYYQPALTSGSSMHFSTIGTGSTSKYTNTHYGRPSTHWPNYNFSTRHLRPEDIPHYFEVVK